MAHNYNEGLFDGDGSLEASRANSWESQAVRHLLTSFGLPQKPVRDFTRTTGAPGLSLVGFRACYPDFPIYLTATKIIRPDLVFKELFDFQVTAKKKIYRFFRGQIYSAYATAVEEADAVGWRGSTGVVIFHPQMQSLLIHNHLEPLTEGVRVVVKSLKGTDIYLEPLRQLACNLSGVLDIDPDNP